VHWETTVFANAGLVANDTAGLGYTGFAYIDKEVKVLALAGPNGTSYGPPAAATYESVASATYPLARVFYFNFNKTPNKPIDPVLRELLRFLLSRQGQALIVKQGVLCPLRASQATTSWELVQAAP
jgi:phosphate transport system substrate-binding protein